MIGNTWVTIGHDDVYVRSAVEPDYYPWEDWVELGPPWDPQP